MGTKGKIGRRYKKDSEPLSIIVVGEGEIGSAIISIEKDAGNTVYSIDKKHSGWPPSGVYDVMHICIPYSNDFLHHVDHYTDEFPSDLVIVHSTVKPKTCTMLRRARYLVHSPVMGKHPDLKESILIFDKFVGGPTHDAKVAVEHMHSIGINTVHLGSYETTELAKILSTSFYGWMLSFADRAKKMCDELGVDYKSTVLDWNLAYNKGYSKMNMGKFGRPLLTPPEGKIGGHCICPNARFLTDKAISREILRLEDDKKS